MDTVDEKLLDEVQIDFPIDRRPFKLLGDRLGISEGEVIERLAELKKCKIIRRIGGVFDSRKLGYVSTLATMKVPYERADEVAEIVNSYDGVTHNYLRDGDWNLWFTLIAESEEEIVHIIQEIKSRAGVEEVLNMPALRLFKVRATFSFAGGEKFKSKRSGCNEKSKFELSSVDKKIIKAVQGDIPFLPQFYRNIAGEIGIAEEELLEKLRLYKDSGVMRRLGAILNHRRAGFFSNAMVVWKAPRDQIEKAGNVMASFEEVSHCYERPTFPDWEYNLFTMVHGKNEADCQRVIKEISELTCITDYRRLNSVKEYKKTSMRYF